MRSYKIRKPENDVNLRVYLNSKKTIDLVFEDGDTIDTLREFLFINKGEFDIPIVQNKEDIVIKKMEKGGMQEINLISYPLSRLLITVSVRNLGSDISGHLGDTSNVVYEFISMEDRLKNILQNKGYNVDDINCDKIFNQIKINQYIFDKSVGKIRKTLYKRLKYFTGYTHEYDVMKPDDANKLYNNIKDTLNFGLLIFNGGEITEIDRNHIMYFFREEEEALKNKPDEKNIRKSHEDKYEIWEGEEFVYDPYPLFSFNDVCVFEGDEFDLSDEEKIQHDCWKNRYQRPPNINDKKEQICELVKQFLKSERLQTNIKELSLPVFIEKNANTIQIDRLISHPILEVLNEMSLIMRAEM